MSIGRIFSIPIEGYSAEHIIKHVEDATEPTWIITANPEILLTAKHNASYAKAIKSATMRTVDGFGLWLVLLLKGKKTVRLTGVELSEHLLQYASQHQLTVSMLGGSEGIAKKAAEHTKAAYPDLTLTYEQGGYVDEEGNEDLESQAARSRIATTAPHILFVAFGHPKQEMWIAKHIQEFPTVKVVVGVGGTFDFWSGTKKRAPIWMQTIGMEWLWRLIQEPHRWKRIWNAVAIFPFAALFE
jgi:N-acetylglucosaminyldiphosphoundecaprenol N-acetyl-beta-D-mannosaminyltransferase